MRFKNGTLHLYENIGFSPNIYKYIYFYIYMKIQDFHQTNSYELTNLCVDTFKTHTISGNQQRWSCSWRFSLSKTYCYLLFLLSHKQYFVMIANNVILHFYTFECQCYVVLYCNVLWYFYDVTRPQTFLPKSWFGGVTYGYRVKVCRIAQHRRLPNGPSCIAHGVPVHDCFVPILSSARIWSQISGETPPSTNMEQMESVL